MRDKTVESFRKTLLIAGLVLLVVFGARAAGQARDMKLAGAVQHRISSAKQDVLGYLGVGHVAQVSVKSTVNQPTQTESSSSAAANSSKVDSSDSKNNAQSQGSINSKGGNASLNANVSSTKKAVDKATAKAKKDVENSQNGVDDLNRIWP